jgi:hypothetical protein
MHFLLQFLAAVVGLAAIVPPAPAAEPMPDFAKVDRTVADHPAYAAKRPLYGLAVFGPKADKSVWLVLDKSAPDAADYDVLYVGHTRHARTGDSFPVGDFTDPATGEKHTDVKLRVWAAKNGGDPHVIFGMRWRGDITFAGGYPQDPDDGYMRFAPTREAAPVVWANGDAPFRFQRWYGRELTIGGRDDFKVFLGQPGRGPNTFFAAQKHFLPKEEWLKATLIYHDGSGKEQRAACELKERC